MDTPVILPNVYPGGFIPCSSPQAGIRKNKTLPSLKWRQKNNGSCIEVEVELPHVHREHIQLDIEDHELHLRLAREESPAAPMGFLRVPDLKIYFDPEADLSFIDARLLEGVLHIAISTTDQPVHAKHQQVAVY